MWDKVSWNSTLSCAHLHLLRIGGLTQLGELGAMIVIIQFCAVSLFIKFTNSHNPNIVLLSLQGRKE